MRQYLLGSVMLLMLFGFIKHHIALAKENDLAQRELIGLWRMIDNGHFTRTKIETRTVRIPFEKVRTIYKEIYVPQEGNVTIRPKDPNKRLDEVVEIVYDKHGFTFRPGLQVGFLPRAIGVDAKVAYANRWGVSLGIAYFESKRIGNFISPTAGITYRLDRIRYVHNTELVFGLAPVPINTGYLGLRMGL